MKKIKKIISILIVFTVFLFIGMFSSMYFLKEDVKQYAVQEINKQLKTEILPQKIRFSVLKKFPDASLVFENVLIKSTEEINKLDFTENTDTLCFAKEIVLNFNIVSLLKKQYTIKNIAISKGVITILTDKEENVNYKIWKESDTQNKSDFIVELSKIKLSQMVINYISLPKEAYFKGYSEKTELKGKFSSEKYELSVNGKLFIRKFTIDQASYLENQQIKLKTNFLVEGDEYFINDGEVTIAGLDFYLNGLFRQEEKANYVDMELNGKDLDINSFISILPEKTRNDLDKIKNSGLFYMHINAKGIINHNTNPTIRSHFGVSDGSLQLENYMVNQLFAEGYFTNGVNRSPETSFITFDTLYAEIEGNTISAKGLIKNFKRPKIHLYTNSDLKLSFIDKLLQSERIALNEGSIISDIEIVGRIASLKDITKKDFAGLSYMGKSRVRNGELMLKKENILIKEISGKVMIGKHYKVSSMNFSVQEDDFQVKGILSNVLPYFLFEKEKLWLDLQVKTDELHLSNYLVNDGKISDNEEDIINNIPEKIYLKLNIETKKFEHRTFQTKTLLANMTYKPKMLVIHSFSMESMGGNVSGGGALVQRFNKEFIIKTQSELSGINLSSLFTSFNNFGQSELKAEHLKGSLSGSIDLYSLWENDFTLIDDKLVASCEVLINNGELFEFEPMYGLSKFINLDELKDIKFSTLENEVLIKDKKIIIPEMEIHSSAFNISGSGVHNFDNSYSYKLRVLLSDVLFNKAKKRNIDIEKHAMIEDDGLGKTSIYFSIEGKDNEYTVSYDKMAFRNKIRNDLKNEKKELQAILKEEFGFFKNDVEIDTSTNIKTPYTIKWDEEEDELIETEDDIPENKNTKTEKINIEWDDY